MITSSSRRPVRLRRHEPAHQCQQSGDLFEPAAVLCRKTRAGATIAFSYDTLNRLATKAPPSEATVTYAYDRASHLIGVSDTSTAITIPSSAASYSTALTYDPLNRPLAVNGTPAPAQTPPTALSATFNFAYDATNRRISQTAETAASGARARLHIGRSARPAGQIDLAFE